MKNSLPKEMRRGGFFDVSTVKGNLLVLVVVLSCCFAIWNFHYSSFWLDSLLGFGTIGDRPRLLV